MKIEDGYSIQGVLSSSDKISKSIRNISSGRSINSASDEAADLAISERMQSQINGTNQAINNSQNGISLVQTAESALGSTHDSLQRMRELAIQSSNGTLSDEDRVALNDEFSQLKDEISQTAQTTTFNGQKLLDGSLNINIGAGTDGNGMNVSISDMSSSGLNLASLSISSADGANDAINKLDSAIDSVSHERGNLGATDNALEATVSNLMSSEVDTEASQSQITDSDIAKEAMELTKNKILEQANIAMLVHKKQDAASVLSLLR